MRRFCFTSFEPTEEKIRDICAIENITYLIVGIEECPSTGRQHLQGYIHFINDQKTMRAVKNKLPEGSHIERAKGTDFDNQKYCSKSGKFFEKGEPSKQGQRTDIESVCDDVFDGLNYKEIALSHPEAFIKYHKGIEKLISATNRPDQRPNQIVLWIWGDTGVGKTRYAYEHYETVYIKDGTQWWDGYEGQQCILIDDFDGRWPFRDLLRLLDRYPYQGQLKGGYIAINSQAIIITCDKPPDTVFSQMQSKERAQLLRRLNNIIRLGAEVAGNTIPPLNVVD